MRWIVEAGLAVDIVGALILASALVAGKRRALEVGAAILVLGFVVQAVGSWPPSRGSRTAPPSPVAGGSTTLASDTFGRIVPAGFGAADVGGVWHVSASSQTEVSGGRGVIYGWTSGNQDMQAWLPLVGQADTDTVVEVGLAPADPSGAAYQARLVARSQADPRDGYAASIVHQIDGSVGWALSRRVNAGGTDSVSLGHGTLLDAGGAGTSWWVRLRVQGTSIQAKFWPDGTSEPPAWNVSATDRYWTTGGISLGVYVGSGLAAPYPSTGFDNVTVTDLTSAATATGQGG